jgi:hypothetical protein
MPPIRLQAWPPKADSPAGGTVDNDRRGVARVGA